jgi:putative ABC transport system permease protein
MENLLWDLRFAARTLRRQPAFAFSTVITLGMAIALAATAYGILYAYLVRSIPYPAAERLVHLRPTPRGGAYVNAPSLAAVDWRATDSIFEKSVSWNPDRFILRHADRAHVMEGAWASPDFFAALGIQPVLGRGFASREYHGYAPVMMISDALWSRLFARDSAVVGRAMRVQSLESTTDAELLTVVGIMPPPTWHVGRDVDVLRPLQSDPHLMPLMARLKPGMSGAEAERRLNAVVLPQLGAIDPAYGLSLVELRTQYTSRVRPTLILLTAGAGFLLLVAGASVSGAQTARMTARRPEIVLRSTLGASRARIAAQLVVENLLIAVLASIVGAAVAQAVLATFGGAIGQRLGLAVPGGDEQLALGLGMLAAIVTAALLLGAMFGLLPAMIILRG